MSSSLKSLLGASALVMTLCSSPLLVQAGSAPTFFAPDQAAQLLGQAHSERDEPISADLARKIALAIVDDASRRDPGTIEQVQADQALVLELAHETGDDPEILAIHANLLGVEAGLTDDLVRVLSLAKISSRALDSLVRDNPEVGGTLMQRGLNALHAPPIAGRIQIAIDDFQTLLDGDFNLEPAGLAEVRLLLAQAYIKAGQNADARALLIDVAKANVPRWSDEAKTILAGF